MEELKAKIKELEKQLDIEKQSKQLLQEGYDLLMELYVKLGRECNQIKDEIKKNLFNLTGQSLNEDQILLDQIVIVMKEFSDYKMKVNKEIDELREQTFAAIENYNSKIRKLNEMLSKIDKEKVIEQISKIFEKENKENQTNG